MKTMPLYPPLKKFNIKLAVSATQPPAGRRGEGGTAALAVGWGTSPSHPTTTHTQQVTPRPRPNTAQHEVEFCPPFLTRILTAKCAGTAAGVFTRQRWETRTDLLPVTCTEPLP